MFPDRVRRACVSVGSREFCLIETDCPKCENSVLLNFWESFLVTLPSISSEGCVMYSRLIPGTDMVRDWLFLVCSSCVSCETVANFRLFLKIAIFWEKFFNRFEDWMTCFFVKINLWKEQKKLILNKWLVTNSQLIVKVEKIRLNNSTLVSPIYTFSLAGNINVYRQSQKTYSDNYFNNFHYWEKILTLAGNKHLSNHFSHHRPRVFQLWTDKCTGLIHQKWTSKCLLPRRHKEF